jgi:hypothetical protein
MSGEAKPYRDALRRVLEVAPVDGGPVDPTAIHDAIGSDIILDLFYWERWVVGVSGGAGPKPGDGPPLHPEMRRDGGAPFAPFDTAEISEHVEAFNKHVRDLVDLQRQAAEKLVREAVKDGTLEAPVVEPVIPDELDGNEEAAAMRWFEQHRREILTQRDEVRRLRGRDREYQVLIPIGSAPKGVPGARCFGMAIFESPVVSEPMVVPAPVRGA